MSSLREVRYSGSRGSLFASGDVLSAPAAILRGLGPPPGCRPRQVATLLRPPPRVNSYSAPTASSAAPGFPPRRLLPGGVGQPSVGVRGHPEAGSSPRLDHRAGIPAESAGLK